ncbi:MAG: hypothetical protein ACRD1H_08280, partial [Vicinamibacterales bacterium]
SRLLHRAACAFPGGSMGVVGRILAFPFRLLWGIVRFIVAMTGRLLAVLLGVVLVAVGVLLTLTVIGAIVGVPLIAIGVGLILKGIAG